MTAAGSVTAEELLRGLERRHVSLPAEIGTFVVLEGCDAMLATGPRELADLSQVRISREGAVVLSGPGSDDERGARDLHRILGRLLVAAGPTLPSALMRLAECGPPEGFSLSALHDALEAALVPLNRHASRRVLARFARDASHAASSDEDADATLQSLLEEERRPANDVAPEPGERAARSDEHAEELSAQQEHRVESAVALARRVRVSEAPFAEPHSSPSLRPSFAPPGTGRGSLDALRAQIDELSAVEHDGRGAAGARKLFIGLALSAVAVGAVVLALSLRAERSGEGVPAEAALDQALAKREGGDLIVHVSEPGAQVLRFVGRAPVSVAALAVGVAHEFVATAEGHRPARVLVPADADWEATAEGARFEVAMQLDEAPASQPGAALELGKSRLATQSREGSSRTGTVRVVTTPRGARVYQLVGFAPLAELEAPLDAPQELLIFREGYVPVVRVLSPGDFLARGSRHVAELSVTLTKRE